MDADQIDAVIARFTKENDRRQFVDHLHDLTTVHGHEWVTAAFAQWLQEANELQKRVERIGKALS